MKKILIVDDEIHILELLKINLEAYGYQTEGCLRGSEVLDFCLKFKPDIILLDIMLPDITGLELCNLIRKQSELKNIGIIMISAKGEEEDKITGLNLGADDYITKPFSIKEVTARIASLLRRINLQPNKEICQTSSEFNYRDLSFSYASKEAFKSGKKLDLTGKELKLLEYLILNFGKVVSREILLEKIWNNEEDGNQSRSLDVYIRKLRIKLDEECIGNSYIETVHGKGYKIG